MNRRTTTAATTCAAALLAVGVLGSILAGGWADAGADHLGVTASGRAPLPLRVVDPQVTIEARPETAAAIDAAGRSAARDPGSRELAPAAQRDIEMAAWLAKAGLADPSDFSSVPASVPPSVPPSVPSSTAAGSGTADAPPATPAPGTTSGTADVSASFTVGSLNVLGSSHTRGGARGKATGVQRVGGVVELLGRHALDVVGFQELQSDQLRELRRRAPGWDLYPGTALSAREGENSLAWRSAVWEPVSTTTVAVPYFDGHVRRMPVVVLRHRATGIRATFVNVHNPADTRRYRGQQRWRDRATDVEVSLVNRLTAGGTPVFLTGDMNERDEYFCAITGRTPLRAARGGSNGPGGCDPGSPRAVDWVFGSPGVRWSGYTEDRSPLVARTTDHPVIAARATVDTAAFPRAVTG